MKRTDNLESDKDDMRSEYNFDYNKARPNRFADKNNKKANIVIMLDPDIAEFFTTSESVNTLLRALITTMPNFKQKT